MENILTQINKFNNLVTVLDFISKVGTNPELAPTGDQFEQFGTYEGDFIEKLIYGSVIPTIVHVVRWDKGDLIIKGQKYWDAIMRFFKDEIRLNGTYFPELRNKYCKDLSFPMKRRLHNAVVMSMRVTLNGQTDMNEVVELFE